MMRSYKELINIPSFMDRYEYLKLNGQVCGVTFGGSRWLNQCLYSSPEWRSFRDEIIIRDSLGGNYPLDLAHPDRQITSSVYIHHLNPITIDDVRNRSSCIFDPDNVVSVSYNTHNAIHYGSNDLLVPDLIERKPYDTVPWRM